MLAKWDEMFGEKPEELIDEVKVKTPRKKAVAKKKPTIVKEIANTKKKLSVTKKPAKKKSVAKKTVKTTMKKSPAKKTAIKKPRQKIP